MFNKITLLLLLCSGVSSYAIFDGCSTSDDIGLLDTELRDVGPEMNSTVDNLYSCNLGCMMCEFGSSRCCSTAECNFSYSVGLVAHALSRCFQPVFTSCEGLWTECHNDFHG